MLLDNPRMTTRHAGTRHVAHGTWLFRSLLAVGLVAVLLAPADVRAADDTFVKDVAPILNRSCVGCHRPGEAAPMSLVGYENVRPWVRAIRQRVFARQMPPWTADPAASVGFENDPSLSQAEIDRIVRWIDAGAPRGDGAEPAPPTLALGWSDPSGPRTGLRPHTAGRLHGAGVEHERIGRGSESHVLREGAVRR